MSVIYGARFPACMGGFCAIRDRCARYHQWHRRAQPSERLCENTGWHSMFIQVQAKADRDAFPVVQPFHHTA